MIKSRTSDEGQALTRTNVLVAEGDTAMRQAIQVVLSTDDGLRVVGTAANVGELLSSCGRLRPDVILMNMRLSGADGLSTARHIRKHYPETQVVLLSLWSNRAIEHAAREAGAYGLLTVDTPNDKLTGCIRAAHVASTAH